MEAMELDLSSLISVKSFVDSFKTSSKLYSLETFSCILSNDKKNSRNTCLKMTKRISSTPGDYLITLASSPIDQLSIAALSCLKEIAGFDWGVHELYSSKYEKLIDQSEQRAVIKVIF